MQEAMVALDRLLLMPLQVAAGQAVEAVEQEAAGAVQGVVSLVSYSASLCPPIPPVVGKNKCAANARPGHCLPDV